MVRKMSSEVRNISILTFCCSIFYILFKDLEEERNSVLVFLCVMI